MREHLLQETYNEAFDQTDDMKVARAANVRSTGRFYCSCSCPLVMRAFLGWERCSKFAQLKLYSESLLE